MRVKGQDPLPSQNDFLQKVKDAIKGLHRDIFVVLDGLDGFPPPSNEAQNVERKDVLNLICQLIEDANPNLHVLFVSKNEKDIEQVLETPRIKPIVDSMDVQKELEAEVDAFIERTLENDKLLRVFGDETHQLISQAFHSGEKRYFTRPNPLDLPHRLMPHSFLWVTSTLADLHRCRDEKQIKRQLEKVPNNMAMRYDRALANVEEGDQTIVRLILMWLLRQQGDPLTVQEMVEAVGLGRPKEVTDKLARLPIEVKTPELNAEPARGHGSYTDGGEDMSNGNGSGGTGTVRDEHRYLVFESSSANKHLDARFRGEDEKTVPVGSEAKAKELKEASSWFIDKDETAHYLIAKRCLDVLLQNDGGGRPRQGALKQYAARYWHEHYLQFKNAQGTNHKIDELEILISHLLTPGETFESWLDSYNPDDEMIRSSFDLDLEAHYDEGSSEGVVSGNNTDDDQSSDDNESRSDSEGSGKSKRGKRADPVYYAVKLGLKDIAVKMIENKGPFERPGLEGTVLQLALYHQQWPVVYALLKIDKLDVTVRNGRHGTPLYIASSKVEDNDMDIVRALIQKGARADGTRDGKLGSALHAAAYFGRVAAVRLLLSKEILPEVRARVDQEGGAFETALQAAAARGHENVVELLLESGANPIMVGGVFGTAFQAALATYEAVSVMQTAVEKHGVERAKESDFSWESAFIRLRHEHRDLYRQYEGLLMRSEDDRIPGDFSRTRRHDILATVLKTWDIPSRSDLKHLQSHFNRRFSVQIPAQGQLNELLSALPDFSNCSREQEWNSRDFRFKAFFWSSINYILEVGRNNIPRPRCSICAQHSLISLRSVWDLWSSPLLTG